MAKKKKMMTFWKYVLTGLKAVAVSIVSGLIFILPSALIGFIASARPIAGFLVALVFIPVQLAVWGWLAKLWWGWK